MTYVRARSCRSVANGPAAAAIGLGLVLALALALSAALCAVHTPLARHPRDYAAPAARATRAVPSATASPWPPLSRPPLSRPPPPVGSVPLVHRAPPPRQRLLATFNHIGSDADPQTTSGIMLCEHTGHVPHCVRNQSSSEAEGAGHCAQAHVQKRGWCGCHCGAWCGQQ
jgi:hypothetical protein